jgi:flagellar biosynthesis/type III secretory pathway protein FliH
MAITDKLTDIAIKIRDYTKKEKLMKLDEMPTEIEGVYNIGKTHGYLEGRSDGYEQGNSDGFTLGTEHGQMLERNAFWNEYQKSWDNVINATQIFSGPGWTDKIYAKALSTNVIEVDEESLTQSVEV